MVEQDTEGFACKCDLCGGEPACVKECYSGALVYQESKPELAKLKGAQLKQRSTTGVPREKRHRLGQALMVKARKVS
jgi:Fe-S-cluster-containing hydrogenase component 2